MDNVTKKLIHLVHSKHGSWKSIYTILKADSLLKNIYENEYISSFSPQNTSTINTLHDIPIEKLLSDYQAQNIQVITIFDDDYPELLKTIYQPPWVIFAKGKTSLLKQRKTLAVVGSRDASLYGLKAIQHLFPDLIKQQTLIISGLAKGIDAQAHKTAIHLGGNTVGVIAGGFNHIYPKENKELARYMMENQLLLSEYPPSTYPEKWHFPMRNRIISGLARATLIVEARKKSGSLITAEYALNEGREVFAVPGGIMTPHSEGVHELIQQGAKLIKSSGDILEDLQA